MDDTDDWMVNLTLTLMGKQIGSSQTPTPNVGPYRERFIVLTESLADGLFISDSVVRGAYIAYAAACLDYFETIDKISAIDVENSELILYEDEGEKNENEAFATENAETDTTVQPRGGSESAQELTRQDVSVAADARDARDTVEH